MSFGSQFLARSLRIFPSLIAPNLEDMAVIVLAFDDVLHDYPPMRYKSDPTIEYIIGILIPTMIVGYVLN